MFKQSYNLTALCTDKPSFVHNCLQNDFFSHLYFSPPSSPLQKTTCASTLYMWVPFFLPWWTYLFHFSGRFKPIISLVTTETTSFNCLRSLSLPFLIVPDKIYNNDEVYLLTGIKHISTLFNDKNYSGYEIFSSYLFVILGHVFQYNKILWEFLITILYTSSK